MRSERFVCPSLGLSLSVLLSRTRRVGYLALAGAAVAHLCVTQIKAASQEQQAAKPLTTQFVKRQPRLTKPLELKKRPQPKRRAVQREMVAVKARTARDQAVRGVQPTEALRGLARPRVEMTRGLGSVQTAMEPQAVAALVEGAKETADKVDMSLEMMDIQAMDTGEYQAMVIQDPSDKSNIKGFFHMARLRSESLDFVGTPESLVWTEQIKTSSMLRIAEAVNRYTGIVTDYRDTFTPDDAKLLEVPLVFLLPTSVFELTQNESENLGVYLTSGGLLFGDWGKLEVVRCLHDVVERALDTQGISKSLWEAEPLSNGHPLFHCFFDFNAPPAGGREEYNAQGLWPGLSNPVIRGVVLDRRLAAIISEKFYAMSWGAFGLASTRKWTGRGFDLIDPTRALQFGVNIVVFALTQEGSVMHRLMQSIQ